VEARGGPAPGQPELRSLDDEGLPLPPRVRSAVSRWLMRGLVFGEKVLFLAIALALLVIAFVVFVRGVRDLIMTPAGEPLAVTAIRAVNNVLFIVVMLELVRTIVGRLEGGGFQLQLPSGPEPRETAPRHRPGHPLWCRASRQSPEWSK